MFVGLLPFQSRLETLRIDCASSSIERPLTKTFAVSEVDKKMAARVAARLMSAVSAVGGNIRQRTVVNDLHQANLLSTY